jgi:hypothetical protein
LADRELFQKPIAAEDARNLWRTSCGKRSINQVLKRLSTPSNKRIMGK